MYIFGASAWPVLKRSDAVYNDVGPGDQRGESLRVEIGERSFGRRSGERSALRFGESTRDRGDDKAALLQIFGNGLADQATGAEHGDGGLSRRHGHHPGLAIISQRMAIVAPKPGKPKANQML